MVTASRLPANELTQVALYKLRGVLGVHLHLLEHMGTGGGTLCDSDYVCIRGNFRFN